MTGRKSTHRRFSIQLAGALALAFLFASTATAQEPITLRKGDSIILHKGDSIILKPGASVSINHVEPRFKLDYGDAVYWAGTAADLFSSLGKRERIPALRNSDGLFDWRRGLAIKAGIFAGFKFMESIYRSDTDRRRIKWIKVAGGIAYGVLAVRNFGVKRP